MAEYSTPPFPASPPLVGREREQVVLRDALAAALGGHGSLVLIGGEAGLGKTALAEALLTDATAQGALVLVGRCYDLSETPPYGPWAEALARAPRTLGLPPLPAPLDADGASAATQQASFAQTHDYLAALAARQPLVALLDDLHWADTASLGLLRTLGRGLDEWPVLLLATYRAEDLAHGHPLEALLPALVRETRATRVNLRPLDDEAVRELVAARYRLTTADEGRLVAYLRQRAEGNPFYIGELLRTLEEERALVPDATGWMLGDLAPVGIPPLIRQVLAARIDRLGSEARGLLEVAAVMGQAVPLAIWVAVAGVAEGELYGAIDRAAEARLVVPESDGVRVRFAHALIRETVYDGIFPPQRRDWHRRVAEARMADPDADPDAVAFHFRRATDARAVEWLVRAGHRALRAVANRTAAERYETALVLSAVNDADQGARGWLFLWLAQASFFYDPHAGIAHLEEAKRLGMLTDERVLTAYARYQLGFHLTGIGDYRRYCWVV